MITRATTMMAMTMAMLSMMTVCLYLCISICPPGSVRLFHSFILDIYITLLQVHYHSGALPTTALILYRSYHAEALQATASEGLAQGPYLAARVEFEPATLQVQGTESTILSHHAPTVVLSTDSAV